MENGKIISDFGFRISDLRIKNFYLRISNNTVFALCGFASLRLMALLFLIILFSSQALSQSVDSLVNEAIQNNPQLKALQSRIKTAEYKSNGVGYLPPPTLGIEFTQVPFTDPDPLNQALSQNISISQMFMLGGKLSAMNEAERKNISVAEAIYESYKLKLVSEIKTKYYEIWMIEHHMELRDEIITLLENLLKSTEQLYTINKSKYSDLLMLKAELADNNTQNEVLENQLSSANYQMNSLIGRDLNNDELSVHHSWTIDSLKYSSEELTELLNSSNPDLQKMDRMIEMNKLEITANNKELIPDLMLQGMVMRMPRGMILTTKSPVHELTGMGETEYMFSIMASITLPFAPWSSGKYSAKEEELNSSINGLSSEKYDMQRKMKSELRGMLDKLSSSEKQIKLYTQEVIPLYKQALEAQVSEFQNSRISINDLISTMRMLLMKEEELSESQMLHQMVLSEIEAMVGKSLTNYRLSEPK